MRFKPFSGLHLRHFIADSLGSLNRDPNTEENMSRYVSKVWL